MEQILPKYIQYLKKYQNILINLKFIITKSTVPVTTGDEIEKIFKKKVLKINFQLYPILNF